MLNSIDRVFRLMSAAMQNQDFIGGFGRANSVAEDVSQITRIGCLAL